MDIFTDSVETVNLGSTPDPGAVPPTAEFSPAPEAAPDPVTETLTSGQDDWPAHTREVLKRAFCEADNRVRAYSRRLREMRYVPELGLRPLPTPVEEIIADTGAGKSTLRQAEREAAIHEEAVIRARVIEATEKWESERLVFGADGTPAPFGAWLAETATKPGSWAGPDYDQLGQMTADLTVGSVLLEGVFRRACRDAKAVKDEVYPELAEAWIMGKGYGFGAAHREWRDRNGLGPDYEAQAAFDTASRGGDGTTGALVHCVHAMTPVMTGLVPSPLHYDEAPPLVDVKELDAMDLALLAGPAPDPDLEEWQCRVRPAAALLLEMAHAALAARRAQPASETRWAGYLTPAVSDDPDAVEVVQAAVGIIQALATLTPEELDPPHPGTERQLDRPKALGYWPKSWSTQIIDAALRDLVCALSPETVLPPSPRLAPFTHTEARADGRGDSAGVSIIAGRPWCTRLRREDGTIPPIVLLDAGGELMEPFTRAAFASVGAAVHIQNVDVPPADPSAVTRIHLLTRSTLSRSALIDSRTHGLSDRAPAALARFFTAVGQEVYSWARRHERRHLKLALIVPFGIEGALASAIAAAQARASGQPNADLEKAAKTVGRAVDRFAKWFEGDLVSEIRLAHQGNTRGRNDLQGCDVLVSMAFCPDIGAVGFDARVLRVDEDALIGAVSAEEILQEHGRLRGLRSTAPKLLIHGGPYWHESWGTVDRVVAMAAGGPVPNPDAMAYNRDLMDGLRGAVRALGTDGCRPAVTAKQLLNEQFGPRNGSEYPALSLQAQRRIVLAVVCQVAEEEGKVVVRLPSPTARDPKEGGESTAFIAVSHAAAVEEWMRLRVEAGLPLPAWAPHEDPVAAELLAMQARGVGIDAEALGDAVQAQIDGKLEAERQAGVLAQDPEAIEESRKAAQAKVVQHTDILESVLGWAEPAQEQAAEDPSQRAHPTWDAESCWTGRIHAKGPALQQVPKEKNPANQQAPRAGLRHCVVAAEGHVLVVADWSHAQLRIIAGASGDVGMMAALAPEADPHAAVGESVAPGNPRARDLGKTLNFATPYGAGPARIQEAAADEGIHLSASEAEDLLAKWRCQYPQAQAWLEGVGNYSSWRVQDRTFTPPSDKQYPAARRAGVAQSLEATALRRVIAGCHGGALPHGAHLLMILHDCAVVETPEVQAGETVQGLGCLMLDALSMACHPCPAQVKVGVGRSWAEAEANAAVFTPEGIGVLKVCEDTSTVEGPSLTGEGVKLAADDDQPVGGDDPCPPSTARTDPFADCTPALRLSTPDPAETPDTQVTA